MYDQAFIRPFLAMPPRCARTAFADQRIPFKCPTELKGNIAAIKDIKEVVWFEHALESVVFSFSKLKIPYWFEFKNIEIKRLILLPTSETKVSPIRSIALSIKIPGVASLIPRHRLQSFPILQSYI